MYSNQSGDDDVNGSDSNKLNVDKNMYTQQKFHSSGGSQYGDAIKELSHRIEVIEKMLTGSKKLYGDDDKNNNPEKLPMIRRPIISQKEKDSHNKTHFSTAKRDAGELKAEIQAWVKNYFEQGKEKDNLEGIELQLQEMRNLLNRKADQ